MDKENKKKYLKKIVEINIEKNIIILILLITGAIYVIKANNFLLGLLVIIICFLLFCINERRFKKEIKKLN